MERVFGQAVEFWRVRLVRLDQSAEPDLEWREDILYRRPPSQAGEEEAVYRVDAVSLGDAERVVPMAEFADPDTAHGYLSQAQTDLDEMTKSEFERAYLSGADTPQAST